MKLSKVTSLGALFGVFLLAATVALKNSPSPHASTQPPNSKAIPAVQRSPHAGTIAEKLKSKNAVATTSQKTEWAPPKDLIHGSFQRKIRFINSLKSKQSLTQETLVLLQAFAADKSTELRLNTLKFAIQSKDPSLKNIVQHGQPHEVELVQKLIKS